MAPAQTIGQQGQGSCREQSPQLPISNTNESLTRDREEARQALASGSPAREEAAASSPEGVGASFGEAAAAKGGLSPAWNPGYQDACLQSWPASSPEQLVVITRCGFRGSCWLRERVLGLAAHWLLGLREQWR